MTFAQFNPEMSEEERQTILSEQPEIPTPDIDIVEPVEDALEEAPEMAMEAETPEAPPIDPAAFAGVRSVGFSPEQDTVIMGEAEGAAAIPLGPIDFAVDAINFASPYKDIPKAPEFQIPALQAVRELSSIILPTWWLGGLTMTGGTAGLAGVSRLAGGTGPVAFGSKLLQRLGNDKLFSMFARTGIPIGSGIAVDWVNKINEQGDNFAGFLKKQLPPEFKFMIPDNIATLNSDSPDVRKKKTVLEGGAFGTLGELLPATVKFLNALRKKDDFLRIVPKDSTAQAYIKTQDEAATRQILEDEVMGAMAASQSGDDLLDAADIAREKYERAMLRRVDDMDELGALNRDINPSLDEPMLGTHRDAFDLQEEAVISVDDMAVPKAAVDQTLIDNNRGTFYGRIRNMISEAALKRGITAENLTRRTLLNAVRDELKAAGQYDVVGNVKANWKEIDEAGTRLFEYIVDPMADTPFIKELLEDYKQITRELDNLDDVGFNAVAKAISFYNDEYFNLDAMKASALLQTSTAGQISDIAEGARLFDGPELIERAQEMILDRLELLTHEKQVASYLRGSALNFVNVFNRMWKGWKKWKNPQAAKDAMLREAERLGLDASTAIKNSVQANKQYFRELRALAKEDPDYLRPFMLANELTDGDVNSMYRFNEYMRGSMSVFRKLIFNKNPKVQSLINNGVMSNVYNSLLSAPRTPAIAALSNSVMLVQKPLNVLAGHAMKGEWEGVRRGWYAFRAFDETFQEGWNHMRLVWSKSVENPDQVPYVMRENHAVLNAQKVELLESTAQAAEAKGNYGPRYFANMVSDLQDLQNHPVARWGTNALGALDGFGRAVLANGIARFRAYDEAVQLGDFRPETLKRARDKYFNDMQDPKGFIIDPEVEFSAREVSMSLDHPVVDAVTALINYIPAAKPFFMFNRTGINVAGAAWNHSPLSAFVGDYHEMVRPLQPGYVFSEDEIRDIFIKRGIPIDNNMGAKFSELQAEMRGRVAVSSLITMGFLGAIMSDRVHGDGHMNPAVQRVRRENNWAARSIQSPFDGRWYSFEGAGPIADHIATLANIADNFDQLGLAATEDLLGKSMFVLASSLTNRTMMAGVEPMFKMLAGNPKDLARFAAQNVNALAPGAGFRNAFGKLISDGNRELNNDIMDGLRNRNRYLDVLDKDGTLPQKYSWVDGTEIGRDLSMLDRLFNFLSPIQVSGKISPEKEFLMAIEYDSTPSWLRSSKGYEYTPEERSEVASLMGEDKYFRDELRRIMKKAEDRGWIRSMKSFRGKPFIKDPETGAIRTGYDSNEIPVTEYDNLYNEIDRALNVAKMRAEGLMINRDEIQARREEADRKKSLVRRGQLPILRNK